MGQLCVLSVCLSVRVLDGDPAPLPKKGGGALLWPNGLMDQDVAWCADRPRLRRLC